MATSMSVAASPASFYVPHEKYVRRRAEETVEELNETSEPAKKRYTLRAVRNEIIGDKTKKFAFVSEGAVQAISQILRESLELPGLDAHTTDLVIQSAATLGSFSYGLEMGAEAVIESGAVSDLTRLLGSSDSRLVIAAARALKLLFQSSSAKTLAPLPDSAILLLIKLLSFKDELTAGVSASILARCCEIHNQQDKVQTFGGIYKVLSLLQSKLAKVQEAGMECIAALTNNNKTLSLVVSEDHGTVSKLKDLSKTGKPNVKLLACRCITNISTQPDVPEEIGKLRVHLLPIVIKLLEQLSDIHVPHVLACLLDNKPELQKIAYDSNAMSTLISWLKIVHHSEKTFGPGQRHTHNYLKEGLLTAIGIISLNEEDAKRSVMDLKGISIIVDSLKDNNEQVRAAACLCAKSLSRSRKLVKSSLSDCNIDGPLLSLLSDPSPQVQQTACATLINLVLNFNPMKEKILTAGGVRELASLSKSMDNTLRLHSTWAIKNLLCRAALPLKERVMEELTWPQLLNLLNDPEPEVQVQAVTIVRNLVHGTPEDIEPVLQYENGEVLSILERILSPTSGSSSEMRVSSVYAVSNIAAGSEKHKERIMQSSVLDSILQCLRDQSQEELRVAACWVVINLIWEDEKVSKGGASAKDRVERLKQMGFQVQLESMMEDKCLNVKDRVMEAAKCIKKYSKM
jgi:hypothetical protein